MLRSGATNPFYRLQQSEDKKSKVGHLPLAIALLASTKLTLWLFIININYLLINTWTLELRGQTFDGYSHSCQVVANLSRSYPLLEGDLDYHANDIFTPFI